MTGHFIWAPVTPVALLDTARLPPQYLAAERITGRAKAGSS